MKFPVKNVEIVQKISGLALSSSQTQGFDRIIKIFIKSLFFIKLEVNDDKTGLLFVLLSAFSKPEGTHHPLTKRIGREKQLYLCPFTGLKNNCHGNPKKRP